MLGSQQTFMEWQCEKVSYLGRMGQLFDHRSDILRHSQDFTRAVPLQGGWYHSQSEFLVNLLKWGPRSG